MMGRDLGILLLLALVSLGDSASYDFRIVVAAGTSECFYQPVLKEMRFETDFQVIGGSETDLNMKILDPEGNVIEHIERKTMGEFKINATISGDYGVCLDNSFSTFSSKLVHFELRIESEDDELEKKIDDHWEELVSPQKLIDSNIAAFTSVKENVVTMKFNNIKSIRIQKQFRNREAKDRSVAEDNYRMISLWSVVNVMIMGGVFSVQVYMVRNMFEDKRISRT